MRHAVTVNETFRFLAETLRDRRRVLEVGCGRGAIARRLAAAGHAVTALDVRLADPEPAAGVTFVEQDFLEHVAAPYDAVVFTASLHHVSPLAAAIERAVALLAPGGLFVADDFDLEAPDRDTLRWYYDLQDQLVGEGVYDRARIDPPAADLVARWAEAHLHEPPLHTGAQLERAIAQRLAIRSRDRGAYLYRYIAGGVADDEAGDAVAARVLAGEQHAIGGGAIRPVGLRIVALA